MISSRTTFAAAVLLSAAVAGCDRPAPPVDTADARVQLRAAFDDWKAGQPFESLAARRPPIVFNEPLWRDGTVLLDYELGEVQMHGRQARCTVRLVLQGKDDKPYERWIGYQIDTIPAIVIAREGLGP